MQHYHLLGTYTAQIPGQALHQANFNSYFHTDGSAEDLAQKVRLHEQVALRDMPVTPYLHAQWTLFTLTPCAS
jgi:hypothetical protein